MLRGVVRFKRIRSRPIRTWRQWAIDKKDNSHRPLIGEAEEIGGVSTRRRLQTDGVTAFQGCGDSIQPWGDRSQLRVWTRDIIKAASELANRPRPLVPQKGQV